MMATARARGIAGLLAAALGAGCGSNRTTDPGGGPVMPRPQIAFATADVTTGTRAASVYINNNASDVSDDLVDTVASRIRVATWPGDAEVSTIEVTTNVPRAELPNGAQQAGYASIEETLDSALDGSAWYAISLPAAPTEYTLPDEAQVLALAGGARGVRFSPAHPPVVASVIACTKDGGVVAVYAHYSEPLTWAVVAPALDYGATPVSCAVGDNSPGETQFICSATDSGQPFALQIPDGVTAQASGAPMAAVTLDSAGMQATTTTNGCTIYKRPTVD